MRVVVDTDVVAAALLGEERRGAEAARLLAKADVLLAPSHWKAELANVFWKAVVFGAVPADALGDLFRAAEILGITSVDVSELWRGATSRAVTLRQSAYDVLFVELALREGVPMASYDRALATKAPRVVVPPGRLLRA